MPGDAVVFPRIASSILTVLGVLLIGSNLRSNRVASKAKERAMSVSDLKNPAIALLIVIAYVLGIKNIGFYASTLVVLPVFMRFLGIRSLKRILLITLVVSAIVYLIFSVQLGVLLPAGILF